MVYYVSIQYPLAFWYPSFPTPCHRFYLFFHPWFHPIVWCAQVSGQFKIDCIGSQGEAHASRLQDLRRVCRLAKCEIKPTWWLCMNLEVNILVSFLACKDSIKAHQSINLQFLFPVDIPMNQFMKRHLKTLVVFVALTWHLFNHFKASNFLKVSFLRFSWECQCHEDQQEIAGLIDAIFSGGWHWVGTVKFPSWDVLLLCVSQDQPTTNKILLGMCSFLLFFFVIFASILSNRVTLW